LSSFKNKNQIVFITSRFPYPLEKGDKLRAYYQLIELSKTYDVHLISISEKPIPKEDLIHLESIAASVHVFHLSKWKKWFGTLLALFQSIPFQIGYFHHGSIQRKIDKCLKEIKPGHIYCQLIRAAEYVKDYHDCPKTLDYMDALSKGIERRIDKAGLFEKWAFKLEYKRLIRYENSVFDYFEGHTIISEQDQSFIPHPKRNSIKIVANGVSEKFFEPFSTDKKFTIVFTGNMSYPPNIEAVKYICQKIAPKLDNDIKILISGANPVKEVLEQQSNRIEVSGWVDDIRESYASAKIFIAPMFIGTGLQNKLLEAMAMGMPCITTTLANNALGAKPDSEILIANNETEFAMHINKLLSSSELYETISQNGQGFVRKNYTWEGCSAQLVELINQPSNYKG
jgi:polysaccharide biosynthesis protein PslH